MLIASVSALTACAAWVRSDPPPATMTASCPLPVDLPPRALTQVEVETLWRSDRLALTDCGERHYLLVQWIAAR